MNAFRRTTSHFESVFRTRRQENLNRAFARTQARGAVGTRSYDLLSAVRS